MMAVSAAQKPYGSLVADVGGRLDLARAWPTTKSKRSA
jgi:hypothetical protein